MRKYVYNPRSKNSFPHEKSQFQEIYPQLARRYLLLLLEVFFRTSEIPARSDE